MAEADLRTDKSAAAFRTTGEAAAEVDVPAYVLRFWETKFAQLQPLKRGGGRRYYRPEDIVLLRRIRQCLYHDGYTIRGVQQLLRARTGRGREEAGAGPTAADAARSKEPASAEPARQAALDEVRRELLAIRSLLHQLIRP